MIQELVDFYHVDITFPFGELDSMIDWCNKNCEGDWRFGDSEKGYTFWFEKEKDYFKFVFWKR